MLISSSCAFFSCSFCLAVFAYRNKVDTFCDSISSSSVPFGRVLGVSGSVLLLWKRLDFAFVVGLELNPILRFGEPFMDGDETDGLPGLFLGESVPAGDICLRASVCGGVICFGFSRITSWLASVFCSGIWEGDAIELDGGWLYTSNFTVGILGLLRFAGAPPGSGWFSGFVFLLRLSHAFLPPRGESIVLLVVTEESSVSICFLFLSLGSCLTLKEGWISSSASMIITSG